MVELSDGFHVDLLFPEEYSDFIAQVYNKDRLVCVISQENGLEEAEVEFAEDVRGFPEKTSLAALEAAIAHARSRLFELRRRQ